MGARTSEGEKAGHLESRLGLKVKGPGMDTVERRQTREGHGGRGLSIKGSTQILSGYVSGRQILHRMKSSEAHGSISDWAKR